MGHIFKVILGLSISLISLYTFYLYPMKFGGFLSLLSLVIGVGGSILLAVGIFYLFKLNEAKGTISDGYSRMPLANKYLSTILIVCLSLFAMSSLELSVKSNKRMETILTVGPSKRLKLPISTVNKKWWEFSPHAVVRHKNLVFRFPVKYQREKPGEMIEFVYLESDPEIYESASMYTYPGITLSPADP